MDHGAADIITVQIFGQPYPIRSQLDASYVNELANYVDQKMHKSAERTSASDSARIAVLAALNIADEYFQCRDAPGAPDSATRRRTIEIEQLIDEAISSAE